MTLALQPRQRNLFGANFLRCSRRPFSCLKRPDRPDRDPVPLAEHDRLTEKRLEQSVISDHGLPKEVVPIFEKYVRERVMELLIEIDNWMSPYSTKASPHSEPDERIGIAVFQFVDRPPDRTPMKEKVTPDGN